MKLYRKTIIHTYGTHTAQRTEKNCRETVIKVFNPRIHDYRYIFL